MTPARRRWAKLEQDSNRVHVNATTWLILFDAFLAPWAEYVTHSQDETLLSPYHRNKPLRWDKLKAGPIAINGMRSLGLALRRYARTDHGNEIRPSRANIAARMGYGEQSVNGVDQHIERLERLGWVERSRWQRTALGYVNVYRLTVPTALAENLPNIWHNSDLSADEQTHVQVVDQAIKAAQDKAQRGKALTVAYAQEAA